MKNLFLICLIVFGNALMAQSDELICNELPVAKPDVRATCETTNLNAYFESQLPEKLKKGTHSAVFKLYVDCKGTTSEILYQRGTLVDLDRTAIESKISSLKWKPAKQKSKPVTSVVFLTLEIVNGKCTAVVQ